MRSDTKRLKTRTLVLNNKLTIKITYGTGRGVGELIVG